MATASSRRRSNVTAALNETARNTATLAATRERTMTRLVSARNTSCAGTYVPSVVVDNQV